MNASYAWLKSLVPFVQTPAELRDLLTARCATVDEVVPLRADLASIVVGLVVEEAPHPDSDHLHITRVDAGFGQLLDVVCGAPNVTAGKKYPFAAAGTTLPGGLKLERRKIRGHYSNGVLCSARELALGDEHEGILELETTAAPGTPFLSVYPAGDTRLVIDVLPNRPDLLSHIGVAREVAAATSLPLVVPSVGTALIPPAARADESGDAGPVRVTITDAEGCRRIMGVVIRGVKVGPSPSWMVDRLAAVGSRSISNIVDVTNYMMHESGQPMHAFDVSKLAGPAIVVRRARDGESIVTLDGVSRSLDATMTVIADAERAQAVAGVMGGATSEVSDATTDIFLEVANFEPISVRRTRSTLALSTDASYRFERGVDIEAAAAILERAARMIIEAAGGQVAGMPVDIFPRASAPRTIALRLARASTLLGVAVAESEASALLSSVGFRCASGNGTVLGVTVPSWRSDVTAEVNLVEELARLRGYDSFPDELRPFRAGASPDAPLWAVMNRVRDRLVACGLLELRPMPFVAGADHGFARVTNPLAESESYLRRDVGDTLAHRAEYNLARMQGNLRLFEIGVAFEPNGGVLPREEMRAAALIMGLRRPPHFTEPNPPPFDEWDAKALAQSMLDSLGITGAELVAGSGDTLWEMRANGGQVGRVSRVALDAPVWASPAFGIEMRIASIDSGFVAPEGQHAPASANGEPARAARAFRALPSTPASDIDIALLVPNDMAASRVEALIRSSSGALLESLEVVSEYRGDGVPQGFRSIAWRLTFRDPARTLQGKEIAGRREKLVRTLEGELGVRQRTA